MSEEERRGMNKTREERGGEGTKQGKKEEEKGKELGKRKGKEQEKGRGKERKQSCVHKLRFSFFFKMGRKGEQLE